MKKFRPDEGIRDELRQVMSRKDPADSLKRFGEQRDWIEQLKRGEVRDDDERIVSPFEAAAIVVGGYEFALDCLYKAADFLKGLGDEKAEAVGMDDFDGEQICIDALVDCIKVFRHQRSKYIRNLFY